MRYVLDPLSPTGIARETETPGYRPYFAGGAGKPSLVDSVAGKHGAIRLKLGSDLDDVTVSASEPENPEEGHIWIDIS